MTKYFRTNFSMFETATHACGGALLALLIAGAAQAQEETTPPVAAAASAPVAADEAEAKTEAKTTEGAEVESEVAPELSSFADPITEKETICDDGIDNDGDTVFDCSDADCMKLDICKPTGDAEATNAACSDFIDNDNNGFTDCDDNACQASQVSVCQGSWKTPSQLAKNADGGSDDIPELAPGMTVEDLIGTGDDKDGERSDQLCSDGVDNDLDGATDCADIGCRFDPNVTICRGAPGLRFSIVANVTTSFQVDRDEGGVVGDVVDDIKKLGRFDTRFTAMQLRAFGPLPGIQDSFFLISIRAENAPRLTFAMANFPIGGGHFINVNSGGGGLSSNLILSQAKRPLIDAPFYVYSAFEQGNGAALELSGPVIPGLLDYRTFIAGGSGLFNGNVGGRFFSFNNENYTWTAGAQALFSPIGYFSRFDSAYLYTKVPTTLGFTLGGKYDQRAQERYVATNFSALLRTGRFIAMAETYGKREFEFKSWQGSYNLMVGALIWPKKIFAAADFGQFAATELENPPEVFLTDLRRQQGETQYRMALHWYFWRNVGLFSLVYRDRIIGQGIDDIASDTPFFRNIREVKGVAQFRF